MVFRSGVVFLLLSAQLVDMFGVETVGLRDRALVPGLPSVGLVASEQEQRGAARVEGEQDAKVAAAWTQLLHVRVTGALERVHPGTAETGSELFEHPHGHVDAILLV